MYACINGPGAAASGCAHEFSPLIEEITPETVLADVSGLDRLFGSPEQLAQAIAARLSAQGFTGSIAIAPNPYAAIHAARGLRGVTIIPSGSAAAMLAPLPVELLDLSAEVQETLDCWGIRTFRDLAALPEIGLAERLGEAGVRLQKQARGEGTRPLRPAVAGPEFQQAMELEYPVTELEPLSFVLSRMLHDVCAALESRALAVIGVILTLKLENKPDHARALRLPTPTRDIKTLLKLFQLELAAHPPEAPVVAVLLQAEAAKPRATQGGLYTPPRPEPEKLELTLARIAAVVGRENVGTPELEDTHRPGAFKLRAQLSDGPRSTRKTAAITAIALRLYRPPLRAAIHAPEGRPAQIHAAGIEGRVIKRAGPWRISGDWWTQTPWARDEWDVALTGGALYRIYFERPAGSWFVEGSYD